MKKSIQITALQQLDHSVELDATQDTQDHIVQIDQTLDHQPSDVQMTQTQDALTANLGSTSAHSISNDHNVNTYAQWRDLLGSELAGCHIESILGQGGMGVVFKGRHLILDTDVAIKCLPPHKSNQVTQERFVLEARAAAKLNHPNIVSVSHAGTEKGLHFIVMELVVGESLDSKISRNGTLTVQESLGYVLDICKALSYAERQGLVHRDLKPANILINQDGIAKLADLGLVKMSKKANLNHLTQQGIAMGTPHYMAPEQVLDAQSVDHRADLYSLGCTLFQMLCGRTVFETSQVQELLRLHLKEKRVKAHEINPEIPLELSNLISRLLSVNPNHRPQSANQVITEIYALFDQWATLETPIVLPFNRHRSQSTYQLQSLDIERKKTRRLTRGMMLLSGIFITLFIVLLFLLNQHTQTELSELRKSTGSTGDLISLSARNEKEKRTEIKVNSALLLAHRAEDIAAQLDLIVGSRQARLITSPQHPIEHYWNASIHRSDHNLPELANALWLCFKLGHRYYDIAQELTQTLQRTYGSLVAIQKLKEFKKDFSHPALDLNLALMQIDLETDQFEQKDITHFLNKIKQLRASFPQYKPLYWAPLLLLQKLKDKGVIPLFENIDERSHILNLFDQISFSAQESQLEQDLYSSQNLREVQRAIRLAQKSTQQDQEGFKDALLLMLTPLNDHCLISASLKSSLYIYFRSLRYQILPEPLPINLEKQDQKQLRSFIKESTKFKRPTTPHLEQYQTMLQFSVSDLFKGQLAFEIEDSFGHKNYIVRQIDIVEESAKKLLKLKGVEDWYEQPFKGAHIMVTAYAMPNELKFIMNAPLVNQHRQVIKSMLVRLRDQKHILVENTVLELNQFTHLDLSLSNLTFAELKKRHTQFECVIQLKSGELIELKAPLWSLFHVEPKDWKAK